MPKTTLQRPHDLQVYIARRNALVKTMQAAGGGIAIIPTAPECTRNRDTDYPYRHDSYFYYLTGFAEPESALVLVACEDDVRSVLFCRSKHEEREIWDGFRYGPDAARSAFGVYEAFSIDDFDTMLPKLLSNAPAIWYAIGYDAAWDKRVTDALNTVRGQVRSGTSAPAEIVDVRVTLDEMRLFKDESEITTMREAAHISSRAHLRAMQTARPGMFEYEIEAELLHEFRRSGSQYPAYPSIVAGGANACVLHYITNDHVLNDGDLLLIDAGCELNGYAADITRTFPVNGKFSPAQRDIYQLVLQMQYAALERAQPGNHYNATHEAAIHTLVQGLVDLKLLKGNVEDLIESNAYTRFYMHRTGHWLGMDVHDVGEYKRAGLWRALEPGMVITIEPGCYIRASDDIPREFWNIGVRIEDDVLITKDGHEILTAQTPKTIEEIEAVMAELAH